MIKCKQAMEDSLCGKSCCCLECEEREKCEDVCSNLSPNCKDAINEETALATMQMEAAIEADKTGEDFIYQMFLYELDNHEYGYTGDTEDTLDALGYTAEEVLGNPRLKRGIEKAVTEIRKREGC